MATLINYNGSEVRIFLKNNIKKEHILIFSFFFKFLADTHLLFFKKSFWRTHVHFFGGGGGPLVPLFWISGDISSGFQSQSGLPYSHCRGKHNVHSPRSTSCDTLADLLAAGTQPVLSPHTVAEVRLPGFKLKLAFINSFAKMVTILKMFGPLII